MRRKEKEGERVSAPVGPVMFGVQVLLEFGWQLETVSERLQQENPKLAQRLGEKRKESLAK